MLGASIVWNVGNECSDVKVDCFPGITTEQLLRVIKNRDLGNTDTVVIHAGTNDLNEMEIPIMSREMSTFL